MTTLNKGLTAATLLFHHFVEWRICNDVLSFDKSTRSLKRGVRWVFFVICAARHFQRSWYFHEKRLETFTKVVALSISAHSSISESVNPQSLKHSANPQRPSASLWCAGEPSVVSSHRDERSYTAVHNLLPAVAMLRCSLRRDVFSSNFRLAIGPYLDSAVTNKII